MYLYWYLYWYLYYYYYYYWYCYWYRYYNSGGTMNAWYTIFVDLDSSFVGGLAQVVR